MVKSPGTEDSKSIKLGNTDANQRQMEARKIYAMAQDQEETISDPKTDVLLENTEDLFTVPQEFINDTLANDDAPQQAHKTNIDANIMNFKVKCFNCTKSEPSDTAVQDPLKPTFKNITTPVILKREIGSAAEDENFFEIKLQC